MSQWIDFKKLREKLDFADVLRHYGVSVKVKGDQGQGFCPLPNHQGTGKSPSFSVNRTRGIFQCFGCGAKGNALDFAIRMEGLSPDNTADVRKVAEKLQQVFQLEGVTVERRAMTKMPSAKSSVKKQVKDADELFAEDSASASQADLPVKVNEPLDFELKRLEVNHPYLAERGFSADTARYFGLGFCNKGLMAGRIVIPLHTPEGRLVGYAGRIVDDSEISAEVPKYKFPGARVRNGVRHEFRKSHLVYNMHATLQVVDHLIVVEGMPSVWWLHQAGIPNVVALMGSSCSEEQARLIIEKTPDGGRVTVIPDGDDAGRRCMTSVFERVGEDRWSRWLRLPENKQPTDVPADRLRAWCNS